MKRCLVGWKRLYLSKGGRLALIKNTLSNFPNYLSLFPIRVGVANRLEKIHKDFLWGGIDDEFKSHLVNWLHICISIKSCGLGVKKPDSFN